MLPFHDFQSNESARRATIRTPEKPVAGASVVFLKPQFLTKKPPLLKKFSVRNVLASLHELRISFFENASATIQFFFSRGLYSRGEIETAFIKENEY